MKGERTGKKKRKEQEGHTKGKREMEREDG